MKKKTMFILYSYSKKFYVYIFDIKITPVLVKFTTP